MKKLIFYLALLASTRLAADPLDPASYLNKISQRLTGQWPSPEESDALTAAMDANHCQRTDCLIPYFRDYIQKKMNTPEFYSEATLKVFEKFESKDKRH